jgi:hypothetical protein
MAVATAATVAFTLMAAALWLDPRHPARVWGAALAAAVGAIWAMRDARRTSAERTEVSIASDGAVQARTAGTAEVGPPAVVRCIFVAPWLITLRCGAMLVPIWPDSLPSDAFRRLHACARWAGAMSAAGAGHDQRTGSHDDSAL